jgi:GntR family transcriptional regulator, transcriptional repressor for pyruvate dehydrogenase complex
MTGELRAIERRKLYSAIVERILESIDRGAFPPGSRLPPERVLASSLGVSRSSVREALCVLEYAGVLTARTGSGTYVSDDGVSLATTLRARAAAIGEESPLDVVAARRALEPRCAALAAMHRKQADVDALRAAIQMASEQHAMGLDTDDADLAFHRAVAAASRNPVLLHLVEHTVGILRRQNWTELYLRSNSRADMAHFLAQHEPILAAIEQSDPEAAEKAMDEHLDSVEAALLIGFD